MPQALQPILAAAGIHDLAAFAEAVRSELAVASSAQHHGCAGWVDYARVSAKGVAIRTLHHWPDRVESALQEEA